MRNELDGEIGLEMFVRGVMEKVGMIAALKAEKTVENETRLENLDEFISMVQESVKNDEALTLDGLLESISLISDIDNYDEAQDTVTLMTLHSAKGLEFPNVFLVGMEEGVFPGMRSFGSEDEIEEERRLCYVGITRAKERLYLTRAKAEPCSAEPHIIRHRDSLRKSPMSLPTARQRKRTADSGSAAEIIRIFCAEQKRVTQRHSRKYAKAEINTRAVGRNI